MYFHPQTTTDHLGIETTVTTRITSLTFRKEICDRILAKGRRAVSNINADLAKSFGRRADKLRSSLGFGSDWQDETSELYGDLVSKFAKQGYANSWFH
jgi:hypothetical protein